MKRLLLLACFMVALLVPTASMAQDSSIGEQVILQRASLTAELTELNNIYRGQLAEYRQAERDFLIARDQYHQLQTLASINEVTEAAGKVMGLRSRVLITYLDLLRVNLIATEGIELSLKRLVLERLAAQQSWLQAHQQILANTTDRERFNQLADEFSLRAESLVEVSQQTASLLELGKLQNVFDLLILLNQDLVLEEASAAGEQAGSVGLATDRAVRETGRLSDALATLLQSNWAELEAGLRANGVSGFYDDLSKTLNPIYADLNKLVSFIQERLGQL